MELGGWSRGVGVGGGGLELEGVESGVVGIDRGLGSGGWSWFEITL